MAMRFVIVLIVPPAPIVIKNDSHTHLRCTFPHFHPISTPSTPSLLTFTHLSRIMAPTFVLVTGGNRGLGQGLVKRFLAQWNHVGFFPSDPWVLWWRVEAEYYNRSSSPQISDPGHPTSQALADLPKGKGSGLIVVKYDAAVEQDAFDIVKQLREKHGVEHLDIVVANAGIVKSYPLVKEVTRAEILGHLEVNVFGVVSLY